MVQDNWKMYLYLCFSVAYMIIYIDTDTSAIVAYNAQISG